jgi:hypothetical protein
VIHVAFMSHGAARNRLGIIGIKGENCCDKLQHEIAARKMLSVELAMISTNRGAMRRSQSRLFYFVSATKIPVQSSGGATSRKAFIRVA